MQFPVRVAVRRSRLAGAAVVFFHVLAAGLVALHPLLGFSGWPADPAAWGGLALLIALAVSFRYNLRRLRQLPTRIVLHADGSLQCLDANDGADHLDAAPERLVPRGEITDLGWAVWFRLAASDRRGSRRLMLWRDSCDTDDWRLLRIWLRYKAGQAGSSEAPSTE